MNEAEIEALADMMINQLAIIWQSLWLSVTLIGIVLSWATLLGGITQMVHMVYANIFPDSYERLLKQRL